MDRREECSYKEKCYRRKYEHFRQFRHLHLEELLEKIGEHEIHVPFGYIPSVSFKTLKEQLEIERGIQSSLVESQPSTKRIKVDSSQRESDIGNLLEGDSEIFAGISSSNNSAVDIQSRKVSPNKLISSQNSMSETNSRQLNNSHTLPGTSSENNVNSSSSLQPGTKTFEKQRVSAARQSSNMSQLENYREQIHSQMQMNIGDKLRQASPYNILYTGLETTSRSNSDRLSITFPELLDFPLGLLEESLLINFMIQFGWILANFFSMGHSKKPMTLVYGETDTEFGSKFNSFLKYAKVKPPSSFGSHHTKMMIFSYLDKSIRVVICTANLIESDWTNRTQGVWISDKCEEMFPDDTSEGDSRTNFKKDLLAYLQVYNLPVLQPWIDKVKKADMSHINVFFIASAPGSHCLINGQWGQAKLRNVLKNHASVVENNSYKIITQISSIGSLGPKPESWLLGDILTTFSTTKSPSTLMQRPSLSVIYPSFSNVERSADGLLGGGCLPYSSITHRKQEWLSNYLHNWKADAINRTRAVPHIKSYTRVSPDNSQASYFLLTSANLSKAAWGTINKSGGINILSYEAGVLLLPQYLFGEDVDYFPLKEETNVPEEQRKPFLTLPYDLPLVPYTIQDIPWFIDNLPT